MRLEEVTLSLSNGALRRFWVPDFFRELGNLSQTGYNFIPYLCQ